MSKNGKNYPNCTDAGVTKKTFKPGDAKHLEAWVKDMILWGERVRADILALENAAGIRRGDPGDPPPPE